MKKLISVVIAAYNEEPRIAKVLKIVEHHPLVNEVIVINDGSTDKTSSVVKKYAVRLIENPKNMGKTLSVKRGIEAAKNDIIMLLDADLIGLDSDSITKLAIPVLENKVDWVISIRKNSAGFMKLAKMDWISGERVVPKSLLLDKQIWSRPDVSYGLETLMNKSLLEKNTTFRSVYLPSLTITPKAKKIGLIKGTIGEFKMFSQIFRVLPMFKVFGQFFEMAYLNHKYNKP
jgi:glycosyltransferase involved in cell wall biosynthesis